MTLTYENREKLQNAICALPDRFAQAVVLESWEHLLLLLGGVSIP